MSDPIPAATPAATPHAWRRIYWRAAAALYALAGLAALVWLTPRVPYADEWRQFTRLLGQPFARAVFSADNGHVEILPNLLRLADLRLARGHETLLAGCALLLAGGTSWLLWRTLRRDAALDPERRAAALFCAVFGLFWLGNLHALVVMEDVAHAWLLLPMLASMFTLAAADAPLRSGRIAAVGVLGALATLTFGSGVACFPALAVVFALRRDGAKPLLALGVAALAAVAAYAALPGALHAPPDGVGMFAVIPHTLQLLGAPIEYVFWPLLDPAAAAAVPGPLRGFALACAQGWTSVFGPIRSAVLPQAVCGALVCVLVLHATWRAWRRADPGSGAPSVRFGLAFAWFGIACAALIALARNAYFADNADQIYALRYLPWSSLAWSGWLLARAARAPLRGVTAALVLALPLAALPSEIGMVKLAAHMREVAEDTALGAAVGVIPADQTLGENPLEDVRGALQLLRDAGSAMYAWPETPALGRDLSAPAHEVLASEVNGSAVENRLGAGGLRLSARIDAPACAARVLIARDGTGVGLLRRAPDGLWRGVASGEGGADLRFYVMCR